MGVDCKYDQQIGSCPEDYMLWCETMYSLFGTKWAKLHAGPMWRVVPAVRTLQRRVAASAVTPDASIQVCEHFH